MADDPQITSIALENATNYAAFHLAPHMKSLHQAVGLRLVTAHVLFRNTIGLSIDRDLGCVVIIFDVLDGGTGPSGFDADLLGKLVNVAAGMVAVTRFESSAPYTEAVSIAFKSKGIALLVETVDSRAGEWLALTKNTRGAEAWSLWSSEAAGRA